jgi:hypothetical protein
LLTGKTCRKRNEVQCCASTDSRNFNQFITVPRFG